jgi:uncharacterized tellurite resistance protein B-like protein
MAGNKQTMSSGNSWWDQARKAAEDLSKVAGEATAQAGQFLGEAASQAQKAGSEMLEQFDQSKNQSGELDLSQIDEKTRLAFYGALFAIAEADGSIDKEEIELAFSIIDLENMSEETKRTVYSYIVQAPKLPDCLHQLSDADERLRFGLMLNLLDTAWANDDLDDAEKALIQLAQKELQVSDEQLAAIETFVHKMREIRIRGIDDNIAADSIKQAAAGLSAVGVPLAAVWFSGSVIGFSAAGITSGLAALGAMVGIGGMIPGIGVAILAGAGLYVGINHFLDTGDKKKKQELSLEKERKAQLVIQNMYSAMGELAEKIAELTEKANSLALSAADAEANRKAVEILTQKLTLMRQSVNKRKQALG